MKRLFAIVILLLVLIPRVRADGADDQYVQIYNLIQEGDTLSTNQPVQALAKYIDAQTALQRFQRIYPSWNNRVVTFRLNYLASKITILSANTPGAPKPPVQTEPPPPPPAPIQTPTPAQASPPPAQTQPAPPAPQPPAPTPVIKPQPVPGAEFQSQIAELQNQLRQLQGEKVSLEAKLREAFAAQPAAADPRELTRAQEKIRTIQKENELLQVTLAQEQQKIASLTSSTELAQARQELADAKRQLAEQTARATQLTQENASLQARVKTLSTEGETLSSVRLENEVLKKLVDAGKPATGTNTPAPSPELTRQLAAAQAKIAALESDKEVWRLEKIALQNRVRQLSSESTTASTPVWTQESEHVKQLERERDELQKKLTAAQKELYGRNAKATASRVDELAGQLEVLRARLDIYESKPVPYSPEELALFKKPTAEVTDPRAGKKSVRELPAGTVELVASAQQDFASRSFGQAEKKYLEVLRQDDKNVNTLANLAAIQLEMDHLDDAEKNVKAALAVAPDDAFSLSILGNLKFRQEKYDDALDALSRAAKIDPQNAEIQNFLGLTLGQKGMRNAAETAFRKAVILNPNYGSAQNNLAVFYLLQKPPSVELARWHYEKAVATGFPRNPEMEKLMNQKQAVEPAP